MKEGIIDTCIAQNFGNMGRYSVRYLADVIRNKANYPEINDSGSFTVDQAIYKVLPRDWDKMMADIEDEEDLERITMQGTGK